MRAMTVGLGVGVLLGLFGCAGREPSSTDRHPGWVSPTCSVVKIRGSYYQYCCRGTQCWFVQ